MTTYKTIELDADPRGFTTLWLNRPEKSNAFNAQMNADLIQSLRSLRDCKSTRFLILRGRGKHFSAGTDLAWMQASASLDYKAHLADAHKLGELMSLLYHLPFPTIAAVHGCAFGGAVGLIACCDIAIGADHSIFSLSEVRVGLVPGVISPYVVQAIGEHASRRYSLSAEHFSGRRAQELGLLAETYPAQELDHAVELWSAALLLNSPQAMRICKSLLHEVGSGALSEELRERTEATIAGIRVSEEGQEGLNAFLEKRSPAWV